MDAIEELCRRRDEVKKRWLGRILEEYRPETARVLTRTKDRFANPAGMLLEEGTGEFVDAVLDRLDMEAVPHQFDRLLQYRAIQGQKASQALRFLTVFRSVCRELVSSGDFSELDQRLDQAFLLAVDSYLAHREHLGEVRIAELKRSSETLLRRFRGSAGSLLEGEGRP